MFKHKIAFFCGSVPRPYHLSSGAQSKAGCRAVHGGWVAASCCPLRKVSCQTWKEGSKRLSLPSSISGQIQCHNYSFTCFIPSPDVSYSCLLQAALNRNALLQISQHTAVEILKDAVLRFTVMEWWRHLSWQKEHPWEGFCIWNEVGRKWRSAQCIWALFRTGHTEIFKFSLKSRNKTKSHNKWCVYD